MARNGNGTVETIRPQMGAGILRMHYEGKRLVPCIIEILKNARDWGAKKIWIVTAPDEDTFTFVDNGRGLSAANRLAYVSFNCTTARGARQSGKFGSGTKYFLFSHSSRVRVRTAPEEEPDFVYTFEFTPDGLERLAMSQGELTTTKVPKTETSWPHKTRFGSEFAYTLKDPNSRKILRGVRLAEELAARLPIRFGNIVSVDGAHMPQKPVVGEIYQRDVQHDVLGGVSLEIYRPEQRTTEDELRFGSREIGEIPVGDFLRNLGDLSSRFPEMLTLREVAGTITADFLRDFENEDRTSVKPEIADDPRTHHFVKLLADLVEEIGTALQISAHSSTLVSAEKEIEAVIDLCNDTFGKDKLPPRRKRSDVTTDVIPPKQPRRSGPNEPLALKHEGEYGVGEKIEVDAVLSSKLDGFSVSDIEWDVENSNGGNCKKTATGIVLVAQKPGSGFVRANLPGTAFQAIAGYRIVPERQFRLSLTAATIDLGSELVVMSVNADKLRGGIVWQLNGPGHLDVQGNRAIYQATQAGEAEITAHDKKDVSRRAKALVLVQVGQDEASLICIRGVWFEVFHYQVGGAAYSQPVSMVSTGTDQHRLHVNVQAPGFEAARLKGNLPQFLIQALSLEFARFSNFQLQGRLDGLDPRDFSNLTDTVTAEAYQIFEEILGSGG